MGVELRRRDRAAHPPYSEPIARPPSPSGGRSCEPVASPSAAGSPRFAVRHAPVRPSVATQDAEVYTLA